MVRLVLTKPNSKLSARTLHRLPYAAVADRLAALGVAGENTEAFWLAATSGVSTTQ
jgi:glutamyl-tRNA synthetase